MIVTGETEEVDEPEPGTDPDPEESDTEPTDNTTTPEASQFALTRMTVNASATVRLEFSHALRAEVEGFEVPQKALQFFIANKYEASWGASQLVANKTEVTLQLSMTKDEYYSFSPVSRSNSNNDCVVQGQSPLNRPQSLVLHQRGDR